MHLVWAIDDVDLIWIDNDSESECEFVVNPSVPENLIADLPKFVEPLQNVTIPVGREAVFSCSIENLQTYKVYAPGYCFIVFYVLYCMPSGGRFAQTADEGVCW